MNVLKPLIIVLALGGTTALHAQSPKSGGSNSGGQRTSAAFELPRLKTHGNPHDSTAMPREHATIHPLSANGKSTSRVDMSQGVSYVAIDGATSWSSVVRGAAKDTTFVSFFVYASEGTSIEIAGAKLLVRASSKPGYAQMKIGRPTRKGVQWRDFGGPVKLESYSGLALAALPILTARLDGSGGIWDLYVGSRLGAVDIPLADLPKGATRQFTVHAGGEGARVCGLISSDDNPIYDDDNRNGIDDAFERQQNRGALLNPQGGGAARAQLAQAWQRDQQGRQLQSWAVQRPLPDGMPARPAGK